MNNRLILNGLILVIFGTVFLRAQSLSDDKKDPVSFPLKVTTSKTIKSRIMSLVVDVKGESNRFLAEEDSFPLVPGRLIPSKGLFLVSKEGRVIFRPMPGITTALLEETKLQMKGLEVVKRFSKIVKRKAFLFLNEGSVFTSIQKMNKSRTTYEIQTPQATVSAKGTKFWVTYKEGKGKVGVINGVVVVKPTGGETISLTQNQFMEMEGVGPALKVGEIRPPTSEERELSDKISEAISKVEGGSSAASNPFLTTSEAIGGSGIYEEPMPGEGLPQEKVIVSPSSPNPSNTSTNTVVSPVGP